MTTDKIGEDLFVEWIRVLIYSSQILMKKI